MALWVISWRTLKGGVVWGRVNLLICDRDTGVLCTHKSLIVSLNKPPTENKKHKYDVNYTSLWFSLPWIINNKQKRKCQHLVRLFLYQPYLPRLLYLKNFFTAYRAGFVNIIFFFLLIAIREDWMIYRGLSFLAVVWFGSTPNPFSPSVNKLSLFLSFPVSSLLPKETEEGSGVEPNHTTVESRIFAVSSPTITHQNQFISRTMS